LKKVSLHSMVHVARQTTDLDSIFLLSLFGRRRRSDLWMSGRFVLFWRLATPLNELSTNPRPGPAATPRPEPMSRRRRHFPIRQLAQTLAKQSNLRRVGTHPPHSSTPPTRRCGNTVVRAMPPPRSSTPPTRRCGNTVVRAITCRRARSPNRWPRRPRTHRRRSMGTRTRGLTRRTTPCRRSLLAVP
jgi:hypothetical protein